MSIQAVIDGDLQWWVEVCDVLEGLYRLPDRSIQCVVTSPPYWGLRDYGVEGQLGSEKTPQEYVAKMVAVFAEIKRVLRDDGTCWLNIGDSYLSGKGMSGGAKKFAEGLHTVDEKQPARRFGLRPNDVPIPGLKPKDLCGIPWRLAFALQDDGWYLRQDIIWQKPNPMPESVTDRCTKAHEYVFLLTKKPKYYYDGEGIKEDTAASTKARLSQETIGQQKGSDRVPGKTNGPMKAAGCANNRNKRSVWSIPTHSYKGAHFATFPPALPEMCLKAGTSEGGCCSACGKSYERQVEKVRVATRPGLDTKTTGDSAVEGNRDPGRHVTQTKTVGWLSDCTCNAGLRKSIVLDPFGGAGTTIMVAKRLGLRALAFELNPAYAEMARARIENDVPKPTKSKRRLPSTPPVS